MKTEDSNKKNRSLAVFIRKAAISADREGFRDASMSGLCSDGAQEAAISAIQKLDIDQLIRDFENREDIS